MIDRQEEIKNINLLHSFGFAPKLFATFDNGIAYDYCPGDQVSRSSIYEEKIWRGVAKRLAEMHRDVKKDDNLNQEPFCWTKMRQFFDLLPDKFDNQEVQNR